VGKAIATRAKPKTRGLRIMETPEGCGLLLACKVEECDNSTLAFTQR
jgi:hypothetical protein